MSRRVIKRCGICRRARRGASYTCTNCGAGCCEHLCTMKAPPTIMSAPVPGAWPATCGTCARLPLGSAERLSRALVRQDETPQTFRVTDEQIRVAKSAWQTMARQSSAYADVVRWNYLVEHARISLGERRARRGGSRDKSRAIVTRAIVVAGEP